MEDLTRQETEILAVLAANAIDSGAFGPGVDIHPTLYQWLKAAHSKLIAALDELV